MDWANVARIHTRPSAKRYLPPVPSPDEHALQTDNFANAFSSPEERGLLGRGSRKRMPQVIAKIAQRDVIVCI